MPAQANQDPITVRLSSATDYFAHQGYRLLAARVLKQSLLDSVCRPESARSEPERLEMEAIKAESIAWISERRPASSVAQVGEQHGLTFEDCVYAMGMEHSLDLMRSRALQQPEMLAHHIEFEFIRSLPNGSSGTQVAMTREAARRLAAQDGRTSVVADGVADQLMSWPRQMQTA